MNINQCYTILGIEKTYDEQIVKTAYRNLAKTYHPDVSAHEQAEEHFKLIKEAYETILLFLEFRKKHGTSIGQLIIDEEQKQEAEIMERVRKAREKKQAQREKETLLIKSIFRKYIHSWRIYFVVLLACISIPMIYFILYDTFNQGDITLERVMSKQISSYAGTVNNMVYEDFYIDLKDKRVPIEPELFAVCKNGTPLMVERGRYLGEIRNLYQIKDRHFILHPTISFFNDAWFLLFILLMLPILSFIFMRPNFIFVFFFVHYNVFLHPLVLLYILGGDARLIHLWHVLFH